MTKEKKKRIKIVTSWAFFFLNNEGSLWGEKKVILQEWNQNTVSENDILLVVKWELNPIPSLNIAT